MKNPRTFSSYSGLATAGTAFLTTCWPAVAGTLPSANTPQAAEPPVAAPQKAAVRQPAMPDVRTAARAAAPLLTRTATLSTAQPAALGAMRNAAAAVVPNKPRLSAPVALSEARPTPARSQGASAQPATQQPASARTVSIAAARPAQRTRTLLAAANVAAPAITVATRSVAGSRVADVAVTTEQAKATLPAAGRGPLVTRPEAAPAAAKGDAADAAAAGATPTATPAVLSSRHQDRILLAQLEADLQRTEKRLTVADQELSEGQKQLASFTGVLRQAMLDAGPDATGLHPFVRVATKYAGTPYVWGGESRDGFDCSGMIIRVMRDLGYTALPHSAAEQFNYGKPIAQPLLKPGDLVFFANTYKPGISHVGIYLGKRRFIHAAGTGKGTIVSSLDDEKYQAKYAGARRLVASN